MDVRHATSFTSNRLVGLVDEHLPMLMQLDGNFTSDFWIANNQIEEHEHYYLLVLPLLGAIEESIQSVASNNIVTITGVRMLKDKSQGEGIDNFRYDFSLPKNANPLSVKTAIHNESLYVCMNKHSALRK